MQRPIFFVCGLAAYALFLGTFLYRWAREQRLVLSAALVILLVVIAPTQLRAQGSACGWSTGVSGLSVRLAREGDLLQGRASTFTDMLPFEPHTADVKARPVTCDAPMPPEHRSWRRFPREVPLETGDTLALEEPLRGRISRLEH